MAMDLGGGRNGRRPAPDMNVTPLIDVVLVLLIIFMAMTPVAARRFWVHTPKQEKQEVDQPPPPEGQPPLVMRVAPDGIITVNGVTLTLEELPDRLRRMFAARSDHIIFFDAADDVPFATAMQAMDAARDGGAVTIATLTQGLSSPDAPAAAAAPSGS